MQVIRDMAVSSYENEETTSKDVAARDTHEKQQELEANLLGLSIYIHDVVPSLLVHGEAATPQNRIESLITVTNEILKAATDTSGKDHGFDVVTACDALQWEIRRMFGYVTKIGSPIRRSLAKDAVKRMIERYMTRTDATLKE